jgi:RNA polymerase sigma-70 factor (ECF subfamily)
MPLAALRSFASCPAVAPVPSGAPMSEADTDLELVSRVLKGERKVFDLIVRRYQSRVCAAVAKVLRRSPDIEDVAQETFLRAYRALPSFRGDSSFYTWLYKIAINTARNHLATNSRRPQLADVDIGVAEHLGDVQRLMDRDTPEKEMLREEVEQTVLKAVDDLPEDMRTALTLREVDGMSYEDIAKLMGCPIGTVRSRIFRGREAIDRLLRPLLKD